MQCLEYNWDFFIRISLWIDNIKELITLEKLEILKDELFVYVSTKCSSSLDDVYMKKLSVKNFFVLS